MNKLKFAIFIIIIILYVYNLNRKTYNIIINPWEIQYYGNVHTEIPDVIINIYNDIYLQKAEIVKNINNHKIGNNHGTNFKLPPVSLEYSSKTALDYAIEKFTQYIQEYIKTKIIKINDNNYTIDEIPAKISSANSRKNFQIFINPLKEKIKNILSPQLHEWVLEKKRRINELCSRHTLRLNHENYDGIYEPSYYINEHLKKNEKYKRIAIEDGIDLMYFSLTPKDLDIEYPSYFKDGYYKVILESGLYNIHTTDTTSDITLLLKYNEFVLNESKNLNSYPAKKFADLIIKRIKNIILDIYIDEKIKSYP